MCHDTPATAGGTDLFLLLTKWWAWDGEGIEDAVGGFQCADCERAVEAVKIWIAGSATADHGHCTDCAQKHCAACFACTRAGLIDGILDAQIFRVRRQRVVEAVVSQLKPDDEAFLLFLRALVGPVAAHTICGLNLQRIRGV